MQQRKRLTRANRKPLDSFDQVSQVESEPSNLLSSIHNQNLYLKLVGIALEMSREAGVSQSSLQEVQKKLLAVKGFEEYSMLNQNRKNQLLKQDSQNKKLPYNLSKKYISCEQQLSFLNRMEKQVQEVQTKEHVVYALKKYIEQKKKTLFDHSAKVQSNTRVRAFLEKIKSRSSKKGIQRSNYYGQTLRQIMGRITPKKSPSCEVLKKMTHLKTIWGHTFFTQSQQQYCPVYNVIFDKSQKMIITGGQDGKIKIWSRDTGSLVTTLQGHKDFINKICVSKDNKIILSAANDGVRFFDLENMSSLGGYKIENIMDFGEVDHQDDQTTSIIFANNQKLFVLPKKRIWTERNRKLECYDFKIYNFGSKLKQNTLNTNALTVTPKGFVFLGFIEGQIIIFDFNKLASAEIDPENYGVAEGMDLVPQFILPIHCIFNAHEGDIIEITWNPILSVFSTGAKKDGVCKIWQFSFDEPQKRPSLVKQIKIPKHKMKRKKKIYNCNFCCWNSTYTHMTCSFEQQQIEEEQDYRGDGQVVVYNALKMQITWEMSKSIDLSSIRAIDSHPYLPNIMLICDSYGKIMIADIFQNYIINMFEERAFHLNHPSFCLVPSQCRFSQDGMNFVVATQYGNCSIYGYDIKQFYHLSPTQQLLTNDYKQFIIDPITFKPVFQDNLNRDINEEQNQQIQNMRHVAYKNHKRIDPKIFQSQIKEQISKQYHLNNYYLPLEQIQRMGECYLDYERNQQFLKHNLEEIQNKRMTILYDQRLQRQSKLREIIQEKINRMKEIDSNNISTAFLTNNPISVQNVSYPSVFSNSPSQGPQNERNTTSRRGRRSTRNQVNSNHQRIANYTHMNNSSGQENQEQNIEEGNQSQFSVVQGSEDIDDHCSYGSEDSDQDNQSYQVQNNRLRRRNGNNRRINRTNHNTRIRRNPRRPTSEEIQQLQKAYDQQYGRPKKRAYEAPRIQQGEQQMEESQVKKQIRRVASRSVAQMRQQRASCTLCFFKDSTVSCSQCIEKKFCDGCKNYRGKKSGQHNRFMCFQCFYQKNLSPQVHRNLSYEKYIMSQRTDLFVPQIGDQVVYFFQGYEQFLHDKIQTLNNKYLQLGIRFDIVPHENNPELINIQKCTVTDLSYAFPLQEQNQLSYRNNNLNRVRGRQNKANSQQDILTLITLKSENGTQFRVFHFPGYEFLLKWQIYQDITQNERYNKLKLYEIVKIKQQQIQIMEFKPLNSNYNNSIWKNIIVHKTQNKYLRRLRDKNDDISVNIWNIDGIVDPSAFGYNKCMTIKTREHYKDQILKIQVNQSKIWDIFCDFVDTQIYTMYNQYVQVSMCLKLILERLQKNYYASEESFLKDVKMLTQNSIIFNSKQSEITQMSERLVKMILEGQNYNHDNQIEQTTQKKGRLKRKFNSGSSGREVEEIQKNRRKEVRVSKFTQEMIDIDNKNMPIAKRYRQSQESQDYKQSDQNYESSQSVKPVTRSKRRIENNQHVPKANKNENCRVTRSRTKN